MKQITEKTFFYFAKCPRWIMRDQIHNEQLDALESLLIDEGLLPEVIEGVLNARGNYETVRDEDIDDAFMRTVSLMKQGVATIFKGVLVDGHWVGRPDILERVEGGSDLGSYYYVAVDMKKIHTGGRVADSFKLQGAFYAELLECVQGTKPTSGYVMTPDGEVLRYDLESFEAQYRLTLDKIESILDGEDPGHILTSGCKASPYFPICLDEESSCDDISLLNRIRREEVEELASLGITTVMQLATADLKRLQRRSLEMHEERLAFLHRQAIALKERVHDVVESVSFEKASVEIYFDIEADPVRDLEYLFGVLRVEHNEDGSTTEEYKAFIAEGPEGQREAWEQFANFLHENRYAPVYHYGWFEINVCAKLIERYGAPEGAIESWENHFIDINTALRPAVIFPLSFYSLKDIAQYLGFKWRGEEASGVNSIRWFHDWLEKHDPAIMERIKQYNEDDVRATRVLKEWLEKQFPTH